MGLFKTFSNIRRKIWDYFSCDLEYNFVNWQRLSIYLCLVLIISALFLLQYVGWMGERWMFLLPFRIFINVLFTGTFIAFLFRKILLSTALSVSIGLCVVFNIIVMVSLVHDAPDFYLQAIVSSMVMLTIMLFFAICAYLRGLSYVIALSTVLAYGYCCLKKRLSFVEQSVWHISHDNNHSYHLGQQAYHTAEASDYGKQGNKKHASDHFIALEYDEIRHALPVATSWKERPDVFADRQTDGTDRQGDATGCQARCRRVVQAIAESAGPAQNGMSHTVAHAI